MTDRQDYPAAHSTDTRWFAIDKDGNVGLFDSDSSGTVPDDAASFYFDDEQGEQMFGLLKPLAKPGKLTEVVLEKEVLLGLERKADGLAATDIPHCREKTCLMFLDDLLPVEEEVA
jgi:hypothetical protein